MNFTEEQFNSWAKGPLKTETEKCENAERVILKAINAYEPLSELPIRVFSQGSYRSRTNVRQESDVDICVCYSGSIFYADYPPGQKNENFNNKTSDFSYSDFKQLVGDALHAWFGDDGYKPGKKAYKVHENTYRIVTDVVPALEFRLYSGHKNGNGSFHYDAGIAFIPESGKLIKNWPEQNFSNGERKNFQTGRHYKRVVRILKSLCYRMREDKIKEADLVNSFLIESLVYNVPNDEFFHQSYFDDLRAVIVNLWNRTKADRNCDDLVEANEFKQIFAPYQSWTQADVHRFLHAVWNYVGFK